MEITFTILRTIKAGYWLKTIWSKRIHYLNLKKKAFVLFEGLLLKIKNDLIKFLLNLNIVVSNEEKNENNQEEIKEKNQKKKLVEMKSVLVALEKNLNIVTETFKFKFF